MQKLRRRNKIDLRFETTHAIGFTVVLVLLTMNCAVAQRTWDTIPALPKHYTERIATFKKEKLVTGKVVLLGDGFTEGANWKKILKDSTVINRGINGDITFGVLNRLGEVVQHKPSKLFLLIGLEDLAKGIPEEVVLQNIITAVRTLKSGTSSTQLFILSILPINSAVKEFPKKYDQTEHITAINLQLKKLSKHFGYTYVDLSNQFTNSVRQLDEKYSYDGVHLTAAGYLHWAEILKNSKYL